MAIESTISEQELADSEAVVRAIYENRPVDPEVSRRVEERANQIRVAIAKRGVTNIAVELIRELRDA